VFQKISDELFSPHGYTGVDWAMTFAEKFALCGILQQRRPPVSIEIGTLNGGSLSVISHYSEKVYSIDPNPEIKTKLADQFPNVDFITAESQAALPDLIKQLSKEQADLGFVLIDGDHSEAGVRTDILEILKYIPVSPLWLLMHDSFNPDCRRAMKSIDWRAYPHVHWVNFDFIPGFLSSIPGWENQMWCGLALAYLDQTQREGPLQTGELLARQFNKLLPLSGHQGS